jgi:hypothetical protein
VTVANPHGTAFLTWRDAQIHHFEGDDTTPPPDEPVTENFSYAISERIYTKMVYPKALLIIIR